MVRNFYGKYIILAAIAWTLLVGAAYVLKAHAEDEHIAEIIKNEALSILNKDKALAFWLMKHNGAPAGANKGDDVLQNFAQIVGARVKIIGYKEFSALKQNDPWLYTAVEKLDENKSETYEILTDSGGFYSRLATPMRATAQCIGCHGELKTNDLIGVMTLHVPMRSYESLRNNILGIIATSHIVALFIGLLFIYIIYQITKSYVHSIEDAKAQEIKDYDDTLKLMVGLMEERDAYTAGHAQRVADYCELIAIAMGFAKERIDILVQAAKLHDIGKVAVPDTVLLKPGKLNEDEYKAIQEHVNEGYIIISQITKYAPLAEIIKYHHERYDGLGYPYHKKGDDVPIESAIMSVADSFDAMTTSRIYKPRKSIKDALLELERCSGTQFNPKVVEAAVKALANVQTPEHVSQLSDNIHNAYKLAYFYMDSMTSLYNIEYLKLVLSGASVNLNDYAYCTIISIENLTAFNKQHGWEKGDEAIKKLANEIKETFVKAIVFRVYGDIFVVLNTDTIVVDKHALQLISGLGLRIKAIAAGELKNFDYEMLKKLADH